MLYLNNDGRGWWAMFVNQINPVGVELLFHANQGRDRRLLKFAYLVHSTKSDVTSGLNCATQLLPQREKMAFRLGKILVYLQTIRFVSFHTEDRNMLQAHFFDFSSKTLAKENSLVLFWRKITESLLSSNGRFCTFAKLVLFRLLVLIVHDSVNALIAIAYNVNNNLDEVLLAIVGTVYNGNTFNRSRFFWKWTQLKLCNHVRVVEKTSWIVLKVIILYLYLLSNTVFLCEK